VQQPNIVEVYEQLKISDEVAVGAYANTLMISHSQSEFCLDFILDLFPARWSRSASSWPRRSFRRFWRRSSVRLNSFSSAPTSSKSSNTRLTPHHAASNESTADVNTAPRPIQPDGKLHGVVAAIHRPDDDRWLLVRRSATVAAPLKVCFPGGGVEIGESIHAAIIREMREELGVAITPVKHCWTWDAPDRPLKLFGWIAELAKDSQPLPPTLRR